MGLARRTSTPLCDLHFSHKPQGFHPTSRPLTGFACHTKESAPGHQRWSSDRQWSPQAAHVVGIRRFRPLDHDLITALVLFALHGVVDLADELFEDVLQEEDPDEAPLRVAHVPEV